MPSLDLSGLGTYIKSHKLWCQGKALPLPVPMVGKTSAPKLIHYLSSQPAAFGF